MLPLTNDAVVLGLLASILGLIFYADHKKVRLFKYLPAILFCYFIPAIFNTLGIIDGENSQLYFVASRYLLPACLVLLTISVDLGAISKLGSKALALFFTGTIGIVLGGPLAIIIVSFIDPEIVGGQGPDAVWRGLTTIAGSWIGGGANQTAMKEIFEVDGKLFSSVITVDVFCGYSWMAILLYFAGKAESIDERMGADTSSINYLRERVEAFQKEHNRIPSLTDFMLIIAVGFGITGLSHLFADLIAPWIETNAPHLAKFSLTSQFFWTIVIATTIGVLLSFTRLKTLEGAGASKIGSAYLYILIATIGMQMDITAIAERPGLFLVGAIWISFHAILLIIVARLLKAPLFFMAVGSQANVGGAASAPVVASAFHPALASVGVLLAVLGYAVGTYAAWLCGILMQGVAP